MDEVTKLENVKIYGAGLAVENNRVYTNGGRLCTVVGEGDTIEEARDTVYDALTRISGNIQYRKDIGLDVSE